ncbi:MAG: HAD family hydrolase [Armatimonadetes bacterium]|nr:HAD family hydrolase [Armatimonadota bacterium]
MTYTNPSVRDLWAKVIVQLDLPLDVSTAWEAQEEATRVLGPYAYDYLGRMREFWTAYNRFVLKRAGIHDPSDRLARAINDCFLSIEPQVFHPFPETDDVLRELKDDGYPLHVISNATEEVLGRLQRLNLSPYFESITFSQEARAEKPDPAVFHLALRRAGCRPEEAVYVGNDYEADVIGARGVGMIPILIDRNDVVPDADCLRIRSLKELKPLLDEW